MQKRKTNQFGENHPRAKLTDAEVETIRSLHDQGMSYRELAKKFEISKSTAESICLFRRRPYMAQN